MNALVSAQHYNSTTDAAVLTVLFLQSTAVILANMHHEVYFTFNMPMVANSPPNEEKTFSYSANYTAVSHFFWVNGTIHLQQESSSPGSKCLTYEINDNSPVAPFDYTNVFCPA